MRDFGYIEHAITLLSGVDEETGLAKVHPDNFLTNEQIKAVQDLVTFVKMYIDFAESPRSDLGLVRKPITMAELLKEVKLTVPTDSWFHNCLVNLRIDDKVYPAHTVTLLLEGMLNPAQVVIDG